MEEAASMQLPYFEWGGKNADGTWGWDTHRPASEGWDVPVHQLMVNNGVTAYFHGHDHMYAWEELDGIAYVECPKPDDAGYTWEPYSYGYNEDLYTHADYQIQNSGHVRVTVSPTNGVTIDYVRSDLTGDGTNGVVANTHTILPENPPENEAPVVTDIPNQTIAEGTAFSTINLDDYVSDADNTDAQMNWTFSGNSQLSVNINGSRVATITTPNADWNGAETITFRATDPGNLFSQDSATFTVTPAATATIQGVTHEVNGNVLGGVTVTVDGGDQVVSESNGTYQINVSPGTHSVVASKTGYRSQTVSSFSAATAGNSYPLDFKGNNGLVPNVVQSVLLIGLCQ